MSGRLSTKLAVVLATAALAFANPVSAATYGKIGFIDSPQDGVTYTRPPGAPHVLVDFKASGMEVWIENAQPFEWFHVQVSFYFELDGAIIDSDTPPAGLIQCDAEGRWRYKAHGTGVMERAQLGVGPGTHKASILSDLVDFNGNSGGPYTHHHTFTVN